MAAADESAPHLSLLIGMVFVGRKCADDGSRDLLDVLNIPLVDEWIVQCGLELADEDPLILQGSCC